MNYIAVDIRDLAKIMVDGFYEAYNDPLHDFRNTKGWDRAGAIARLISYQHGFNPEGFLAVCAYKYLDSFDGKPFDRNVAISAITEHFNNTLMVMEFNRR